MAGIYIHIPFCKTRCSYCDFFTATDKSSKNRYIESICKELILKKNHIEEESIETIYFGGGTPSQLEEMDFNKIFETINQNYTLSHNIEITLEANPDDLNIMYIDMLRKLPFNRISIGIQSFDDNELKSIDRRHSAQAAKTAVENCQKAGFKNVSIDLMYGLPGQTMETWKQSLEEAISLTVQHISSYHLIYEDGTKMNTMLERGKIKAIDEDISTDMFSYMNLTLKNAGFIHYEVSNFCQEGFHSQHNSSYWNGEKYIGIGASAHSYDGKIRYWNVSSMKHYMEGVEKNTLNQEIEELSLQTQYNDYILTRMRTMWGANIEEIEKRFGSNMKNYFLENIKRHLESKDIKIESTKYKITEKGLFVSDGIMSDLMFIG